MSEDGDTPPPPGNTMLYFTVDDLIVEGPVSADALLLEVKMKKVPREIRVNIAGSSEWLEFQNLPSTTFTRNGLATADKAMLQQAKTDGEEFGKRLNQNLGVRLFCLVVILAAASIFGRGCAALYGI